MPNGSSEQPWSNRRKALLNAILDQLIPASPDGRVPAGGRLHVADYLAAKTRESEELQELFRRGLDRAESLADPMGNPPEELSDGDRLVGDLQRADPEFFGALLRYAYMGYYTEPSVPRLFGLTSLAPHPDGYDVPDQDLDELQSLVASVKARGRLFREC